MADAESIQEHHHRFSASAHNQAMDILYSDDPTDSEIESLIELAHWHWIKREDKTPKNISVSLWLLSRAYAANGFGTKALIYAQESLAKIENEDLLPSFYGYSNEALARAHLLLGNEKKATEYLNTALKISETVPNEQAKEYLLDQIKRIKL
jgi:tetratricopeptide (TPR) repeat protein